MSNVNRSKKRFDKKQKRTKKLQNKKQKAVNSRYKITERFLADVRKDGLEQVKNSGKYDMESMKDLAGAYFGELAKKEGMLKVLSRPDFNAEMFEDSNALQNIPALLQESAPYIASINTMCSVVETLEEEKQVVLTPEVHGLIKEYDQYTVRLMENATVYLTLFEEMLAGRNFEELDEETQQDVLAEINESVGMFTFDIINVINEMFTSVALEIMPMFEQYSALIDNYVEEHTLDNEQKSDFVRRKQEERFARIRELYETKVTGSVDETINELETEMLETINSLK